MSTKNLQKIGLGEKISFFIANVGNIPIMTLIGSYLLIFYTDVVGLDVAAVGTLFLLTKVLDGINDPLVGFIIDRIPRGKNGKFKGLLFIGSFLCAINFLLLWYGPALAPTAIKLVVAYITYILIGITFDIMDISLNSMIPVMTSDMKERSTLSTLKGAGYMLGIVIVSVGAPLLLSSFTNKLHGYFVLIAITCLVVVSFSVTGAIGIKERITAVNDENYTFKQLLSFLTLGPILITFFSQLLFISGKAIHTSSELFFATYVLGDIKVISLSSLLLLLGMVPALIITSPLSRKVGKKIIYSSGLLIYGVGLLIRLFNPTSVPLMYVAYIIIGLGTGMVMVLMYGIQADNIDYVEYSKGMRAEGAVSALQSLVSKLGGALGASLPAFILGWTGYVANAKQTPLAENGIIVSTLIIPVIFYVAGALLFLFGYKLDSKKMDKVQAKLTQLRSESAAKETSAP